MSEPTKLTDEVKRYAHTVNGRMAEHPQGPWVKLADVAPWIDAHEPGGEVAELARMVLASRQNVGAEMRAAAEAVLATPSPAAPAGSATTGTRCPACGYPDAHRPDAPPPQPASAEARYRVGGDVNASVFDNDTWLANARTSAVAQLIVSALNAPPSPNARLVEALEQSVKLQSHYAMLLNMHDGGQRIQFATAQAWLDRLAVLAAETGGG